MKFVLLSFCFLCQLMLVACSDSHQEKQDHEEAMTRVQERVNDSLAAIRFGHPNSRHRNELNYIALLQKQMQSDLYSAAEKEVIEKTLNLVLRNRPGTAAADFNYLTAEGKRKRMYDIHAERLILFFYNPECDACKEMKEAISGSSILKEKVTVLAIYIDREESTWRRHLPSMPKQWIHGRDEGEYLWKHKVYDLKAIPTLYLLDKEKNVLLKDCMDVEEIERMINDE